MKCPDCGQLRHDGVCEEPGSYTARKKGCTCHYVGLGGNDPDGYVERDEWCPLHGRDPDYERDKMEDR